MFEKLLKEMKNTKKAFEFYKLEEEEIKNAEERLGYSFPTILRAFYSEVGYGFIKGSPSFINRIMAPDDVADFMCDDEKYQYVDKSIYSENEMIFFHIADEDFLTIELLGENSGAIKYFDDVIAVDLIDFINRMLVNPNYFI